jgi:hypothetical protein
MVILAQQYPTYQPAMRIIASITNTDPIVVTTTFPHNYYTGIIVRLVMTPGYGMNQVNQMYGAITVTGPTTFTMDINGTAYDSYTPPAMPWNANGNLQDPGHFYTPGQVVPIGEVNATLSSATQNVL